MKTVLLSMMALGIFTIAAWGQSDVILRERAKGIANQNNGQQRAPQAASPGAPTAAPQPAPPPNPALNATLQNIASLQFDLARLETNAAVKSQLIANLNAAAQDKKPSTNSISKVAGSLAAALAGKKLPPDQQRKLAQYCHAIANGAHLSPMQEQSVFDGVQKILQTAQVPSADATRIVADMKVVVRESQ
jgi:hypothetical protein